MTKDYLIKGTAADNQIRLFGAVTTNLVQKSIDLHHTSPTVSVAMGRLLTAGALMGSMMKGSDELLTLKILGEGDLQGILVTADAKGAVKGYPYVKQLRPDPFAAISVSSAIGNGSLTVIKDIGLKEPYVGYSPLVSGEIAEDLTYYYAKSEQIPTSVSLGVLLETEQKVKQAGGFIIQLMPNTEESVILALETALSQMPSMTKLLEAGQIPEEIFTDLFKNLGFKVNETQAIEYHCNCSLEKVTKALISLGLEEIEAMIIEKKTIEMHCDFCETNYPFSPDQLKAIAQEIEKS
ncbi:Hsp33 family molecular chaperone HslO [Eubacteriaceae bacterium ES2]|nr:Hsp33 family molecular chaperone HslO [Eubacteriaceae bacterium ES2]